MSGICYVIGAGETYPKDYIALENRTSDDIIIAADGGLDYLISHNIIPDIVIGDFDSCNKESLSKLPDSTRVITLNPIKDITDLNACILEGISLGYQNFIVFGAMGGRFDHSMANIQLMHQIAELGHSITMYTNQEELTVIHNSSKSFSSDKEGFISVFSLSDDSFGVTETGLKYTLNDATLQNQFALGVSNEFIGEPAVIAVKKGTLLIVSPR